MDKDNGIKIIITNKKASFNYFLSDFLECGIELKGTEVKSILNHNVSINDSYVVIRNQEAFIINMNIAQYEKGTYFNHEELRKRKLLMHKYEIRKYEQKTIKGGYTIVPTKIYFKNGKCKVEIALAKGKKLFDKRETIKKEIKSYILKKWVNNK